MNILGKKVILRSIEEEDLKFLRDIHNDPEIEKYIGGWSFPLSMKDQKLWFERFSKNNSTIRLIIEEKCSHESIGMTGLWDIDWKNRNAYTGIILLSNKKFRHKGYGTDTVMSLMRYAFEELNLKHLDSDIIEYNKPSIGLYLKKCGWKKEGIRRQHAFRNNMYFDRILVGILKEEYVDLIKDTKYLG